MLRRLFHWPGITVFYSPEPITWCAAERIHQVRRRRCVLKLQKPAPLRYFLHCRSGNIIILRTCGAAGEVFQAKMRSRHAVRRHRAEVSALFRLRLFEDVIEEGKAGGVFRSEINPGGFWNMLFGTFSLVAKRWLIDKKMSELDMMKEISNVTDLVVEAVLAG